MGEESGFSHSRILRRRGRYLQNRGPLWNRVGLRPSFLLQLLCLSVCDEHHGLSPDCRQYSRGQNVEEPGRVPEHAFLRIIQVPDRPAQGGRRGHDDARAARPDDPDDEPRDGRDRGDPETNGSRLRAQGLRRATGVMP